MQAGAMKDLSRSRFRALGPRDLPDIVARHGLGADLAEEMQIVSRVLPFRANQYVVDELIDWASAPADPIFQLTFPQRGMLDERDFSQLAGLLRRGAPEAQVAASARAIQLRLNPHPAGQLTLNVPTLDGVRVPGMQHKYRETVLFFPSQGQTCHAYCSYCFRWPQFVGIDELKLASREVDTLVRYLGEHPEAQSVLFTGGDPMVMKSSVLERYVAPLLDAKLPHLNSIRFGTKAPAYWPARFVSDADADDLLRLFERVVRSGFTLAVMAHLSHPRELSTPLAERAIARILSTGAVVRCQAPVIRHVNDDAGVWAELWRREVRVGAVPYYMFVARDTGARRHFELSLARAFEIYRDAVAQVSGLARTARGPSMSATPGKVVIDGVADVDGERVFVLRLLQARDPSRVGRPFFARFDPKASWYDQLVPALGSPPELFAVRPPRVLRAAQNPGAKLRLVQG